MNEFLILLAVVIGLAAVAVGVWAVFPPAVWVGAGLLLLRVAVHASSEAAD